MKKDIVVTFAAWTSEEAKLKKLQYEGNIKAIQKCGFKQKYKLIEIESYRWGGSADTVNRIASNIL